MFQDDNTDGRKNYPRNNVNDGTESNNDQSTSEEGNLAAMFFMFILLFRKSNIIMKHMCIYIYKQHIQINHQKMFICVIRFPEMCEFKSNSLKFHFSLCGFGLKLL